MFCLRQADASLFLDLRPRFRQAAALVVLSETVSKNLGTSKWREFFRLVFDTDYEKIFFYLPAYSSDLVEILVLSCGTSTFE